MFIADCLAKNLIFFHKNKIKQGLKFSVCGVEEKKCVQFICENRKIKNTFLFFEFQISHIKYYCFFAGYNLTHRF